MIATSRDTIWYPDDKLGGGGKEERGRILWKEQGGQRAYLLHGAAQWEQGCRGSRVLGDSPASFRTKKLRVCSEKRMKIQWILLMTINEEL